jgi:hypothetical protein
MPCIPVKPGIDILAPVLKAYVQVGNHGLGSVVVGSTLSKQPEFAAAAVVLADIEHGIRHVLATEFSLPPRGLLSSLLKYILFSRRIFTTAGHYI